MNPLSFRGFGGTEVEYAERCGVAFREATHCWDVGPHFRACVSSIAVVNEETLFSKMASSLGVGNKISRLI